MFTRAEIKTAAKQQISGNIGILFVISLIYFVMATAVGFIPVAGATAISITAPAFEIAFCMIYLNIVNNNVKPQVGDLFKGFSVFGKALWLYILIGFFTFLWSLLLVVPGIIKTYSYMMAPYILAENPNLTAREALNESKEITNGHKWDLFVLGLSFIWWYLLGAITAGLAFIYVGPYISATTVNFYNKIKTAAPVNDNTATQETVTAE